MSVIIDGTNGITSPGGDSVAVDVTTPKVKNAGTLALEATGANIIAASTNGAERARIDSSGNLLVGTTSGTGERLQILGSTGSASMRVQVGANGNNAISFINVSGTGVGAINVGASSTAYNTSSDYRLKENVVPMTGALATVAQLNPVTYTWKADGSAGQGFIAHELQAVVPDCVSGGKDEVRTVDVHDEEGKVIGTKEEPQYQGVDTSFLVATLTAAIQEQQTLIQALTARIEALEQA